MTSMMTILFGLNPPKFIIFRTIILPLRVQAIAKNFREIFVYNIDEKIQ